LNTSAVAAALFGVVQSLTRHASISFVIIDYATSGALT